MKFRILQNCYQPEQLANCSLEPYLNTPPPEPDERYLFLESNVLCSLVKKGWHEQSDYFGVLSHRWLEKLEEARAWGPPIRNLGRGGWGPGRWLHIQDKTPRADLLSFGLFVPHPVFRVGDQCHPGLLTATARLLEGIGVRFDLRRTFPQPIYFNYFLGRRQVLDAYVRDLLGPVLQAATQDPVLRSLCRQDATYFRPFPASLSRLFNLSHYPLHPFIGERLINVYVLLAGASVAPLDLAGQPGLRTRLTTSLHFRLQSILHRRWAEEV